MRPSAVVFDPGYRWGHRCIPNTPPVPYVPSVFSSLHGRVWVKYSWARIFHLGLDSENPLWSDGESRAASHSGSNFSVLSPIPPLRNCTPLFPKHRHQIRGLWPPCVRSLSPTRAGTTCRCLGRGMERD